MNKVMRVIVSALLVGLLASPQFTPIVLGAASGNYTDLLPPGAASDTTVISRGSGWALATLPPTQTFGDALSRVVTTVYQSTTTVTINATATASTMTAISGQGKVGSTTFPATWVASGRSIEVDIMGTYATPTGGTTWNWGLALGTTTVLATGAINSVYGQSSSNFHVHGVLTVAATGSSGSVNGSYDVFVASGATPNVWVSYSTGTTTSVDLTSQLTVNPLFTWGAATSSMTIRNATVKFLN